MDEKKIGNFVKDLKAAKQPLSEFGKLMENFHDPFLVLISLAVVALGITLSIKKS